MKTSVVVIIVLVIVALMFGGMYVSRRNEMVTKNEAIKSQWAQVDVVLQRRADLIPNLVETVKGIAAQEVDGVQRHRQRSRRSSRRQDPHR